MGEPTAEDDGRIALVKPASIVCNLAADVVLELDLEVHTDEERGLIIVDADSDSLSGVRVVFGPDAMIDLCQRGLAAAKKLKREQR
jgi:hypothetical protein